MEFAPTPDPLEALLGLDGHAPYADVQAALRRAFDCSSGTFELPGGRGRVAAGRFTVESVAELRQRVITAAAGAAGTAGTTPPGTAAQPQAWEHAAVGAFVQNLHAELKDSTAGEGEAVVQVASQLNCLEFAARHMVPEMGLGQYVRDRTQGPACALSCLAATAYRTYLVPFRSAGAPEAGGGSLGQRRERQLDLSDGLHAEVVRLLRARGSQIPDGERLWTVTNGYMDAEPDTLAIVEEKLASLSAEEHVGLVGSMAVGVQRGAEVTLPEPRGVHVTQVFTSAVPVGQSAANSDHWKVIACAMLEAAFEATLLAAAAQALETGAAVTVYTTAVGGGAFGNPAEWVEAASAAALQRAQSFAPGARVRVVRVSLPAKGAGATPLPLLTAWAGSGDAPVAAALTDAKAGRGSNKAPPEPKPGASPPPQGGERQSSVISESTDGANAQLEKGGTARSDADGVGNNVKKTATSERDNRASPVAPQPKTAFPARVAPLDVDGSPPFVLDIATLNLLNGRAYQRHARCAVVREATRARVKEDELRQLLASAPSIICLQECSQEDKASIRRIVGWPWFMVRDDRSGLTILVNCTVLSRCGECRKLSALVPVEGPPAPGAPAMPHHQPGFESHHHTEPPLRIVDVGITQLLQCVHTGKRVAIVNVHVPHARDAAARRALLQPIEDFVDMVPDGAYVVTGDFNMNLAETGAVASLTRTGPWDVVAPDTFTVRLSGGDRRGVYDQFLYRPADVLPVGRVERVPERFEQLLPHCEGAVLGRDMWMSDHALVRQRFAIL